MINLQKNKKKLNQSSLISQTYYSKPHRNKNKIKLWICFLIKSNDEGCNKKIIIIKNSRKTEWIRLTYKIYNLGYKIKLNLLLKKIELGEEGNSGFPSSIISC
jgi:hypothetical protein